MRVGIVGAGGQVGLALMDMLANDGVITPIAITRNALSAAPLQLAGHIVRVGSLHGVAGVEELLGDVDVVVNCALATGWPVDVRIQDRLLAEALVRVRTATRIVHLSSVAVYGSFFARETRESTEPAPDSEYGRQKLYMERYLSRLTRKTGRHCTVIRVGHVYGAGQDWSQVILDALADGQARLPFDGERASNTIHIRNLGNAIQRLALDPPPASTYNLLNQPQTSWREVFDWHASATDLARLAGLDTETSTRYRESLVAAARRSRARRIVGELGELARSTPWAIGRGSVTLRELVVRVLETTRAERLERRWAATSARRHAQGDEQELMVSLFFGDEVPGSRLAYEPADLECEKAPLAVWHRRRSQPQAVVTLVDECLQSADASRAGSRRRSVTIGA